MIQIKVESLDRLYDEIVAEVQVYKDSLEERIDQLWETKRDLMNEI